MAKNKFQLVDSLGVRYRPKAIKGIIGNKQVKDVVNGYFYSRKIAKSWLLFGESGAGKTSLARIIARTINCQDLSEDNTPCGKCESCNLSLEAHPDITEINGTAYGKIETSRSLINSSVYNPHFNFKVFIIDEVQGLSNSAKEALLKPFEEPPAKTVWMVCTTEPECIPYTVRGRCVSLNLKYPEVDEVKRFLFRVAKKEYTSLQVNLLKPHLKYIVESCFSQPRLSLVNMEKIAMVIKANKNVTKDNVKDAIDLNLGNMFELDQQAMRFILSLIQYKARIPLVISSEIGGDSINLFLERVHAYAHFMSMFLLAKNSDKSIGKNSSYIKKTEWIENLDKLEVTNYLLPLTLCKIISRALISNRKVSIQPKMIITKIISEFFEERNKKKRGG